MVIFNSYVNLPEGRSTIKCQYEICWRGSQDGLQAWNYLKLTLVIAGRHHLCPWAAGCSTPGQSGPAKNGGVHSKPGRITVGLLWPRELFLTGGKWRPCSPWTRGFFTSRWTVSLDQSYKIRQIESNKDEKVRDGSLKLKPPTTPTRFNLNRNPKVQTPYLSPIWIIRMVWC